MVVNSTKSGVARVTSRIRQGSVLGPLLFLIFINDLPNAIVSCVRLFGDDLNIYASIASTIILQNGLVKIQYWCRESHVQINTQKTFHVRFMRRYMPVTMYRTYSRNGRTFSPKEQKQLGGCTYYVR